MPTYQYACTNPECGERFDLVQSFTDPSASECPVCGGPVRKVFSAVGVVFKGSGFYRNDSRSEGKSGAPAPAKESASGDAKSGKDTKDTKDSSRSASGESKSGDSGSSSSGAGSSGSGSGSSGSGSGSSGSAGSSSKQPASTPA